MMTNRHVLLIEDDTELRKSLAQSLELEDFEVISAASYIEGKTHITADYPGVILSDMRMPGKDGFDVLSYAKAQDPELPVIVLTGEADVPMAVRAIGEGAYEFLQKPCPPDQLVEVLGRAVDHRQVVLRSRNLEHKLKTGDAAAANFPGPSEITDDLRSKLRQSSGLPVNVFLHGPNGAGKRLAAHTIHTLSGADRAFLSLTISDLSPAEISQTAISDAPTDLSAKWIERSSPGQQLALVSLVETHPNIRLIGSATQELDKLREDGLIDDLYFALNLMTIEVPALSQRKKDLPVLFITGCNPKSGHVDARKYLYSRNTLPPPDGYLDKPVDREELLLTVRKILELRAKEATTA